MSDQMPEKVRETPPHRHSRRKWILIGCFALVGIVTLLLLRHGKESATTAKNSKTPPSIPITTTTAHKGDIGVYIEALGIVTPVYTVNVISRVQGQVMETLYYARDRIYRVK